MRALRRGEHVRIRWANPDEAFPDTVTLSLFRDDDEGQTLLVEKVDYQIVSPLGHGTPVPEEATLPSGDARVAAR